MVYLIWKLNPPIVNNLNQFILEIIFILHPSFCNSIFLHNVSIQFVYDQFEYDLAFFNASFFSKFLKTHK